jgi:hypothetical protein
VQDEKGKGVCRRIEIKKRTEQPKHHSSIRQTKTSSWTVVIVSENVTIHHD